jgi:hypothetical protein
MENVRRVFMILVVLGLASMAQGDAFFEDFSDTGVGGTFELDNTGLPGDHAGTAWETFFGGDYTSLNGKGGWVPGDYAGGNAGQVIMIDGWGANPDTPKEGVYDGSGWVSPYFVGGVNNNFNSVAHAIPGTLSAGDEISWLMNISHASSFMDVGIGTNLSDGGGNENWFHIEMGGATGNRTYYRAYPSAGASAVYNNTAADPSYDGGHMGTWQEVVVTMGAGLNTIDIDSRNLTRYDDGGGGTIVGIGPWVNIATGQSTGGIASTGLEIQFSGQGGSNTNWSRSATFDVINITPEPMTMSLLGLGALAALRRRRRS